MRRIVQRFMAMVARFEETKDLRLMTGHQKGNDTELDRAIQIVPRLYALCAQSPDSPVSADVFAEARNLLDRDPALSPASFA